MLSIDHKDNNGSRTDYKAYSHREFYHLLRTTPVQTDLQVLCFNCQWRKRIYGDDRFEWNSKMVFADREPKPTFGRYKGHYVSDTPIVQDLSPNEIVGLAWLQTVRISSTRNYAEAAGVSLSTAQRQLNRMSQLGCIDRIGKGPNTLYSFSRLLGQPSESIEKTNSPAELVDERIPACYV